MTVYLIKTDAGLLPCYDVTDTGDKIEPGETQPLIGYGPYMAAQWAVGTTQTKRITLTNGNYIELSVEKRGANSGYDTATLYKADGTWVIDGGLRGAPFVNGWGHMIYLVKKGDDISVGTRNTPGVAMPTVQSPFFPEPVVTTDANMYALAVSTTTGSHLFDDYVNGSLKPDNADPYENGGISGTGGGTGDFDGTGDDIQIPNLPTLSAVDTGMIALYAPTVQDLHNLANYLWGSLDITNWNRILTDPLQAVLGLSIVPVSAAKGITKSVWVGNINTGVNMVQYASQYASVDCGTLNVNEYWGGYLDYDPYTKAELYLPYIGARPIAVDDIMGKSVHVVYHVDILSGACVAYVEVDGTVLYNFIGQCSCSIPISGGDWTNVLNGVLQIASAVGMMVATEGASIPATIGAAGSAASGIVNAMRPNIEKSGAMSGMGGMMGVQTPYLILTRPRQCLPANQNRIEGYPSFITAQLGELTGFTMVHKIELFDIGATREEYAEIEQLLMEGVIL